MLELLVSVCLVNEPSRCREVSLAYAEEGLTPMQCMMGAQAEIAKWIEIHPEYALKRWTCQRAGRFAKA
ncbi:MAG: hypothetical protein NW216_03690 [Hyphomicrobium sp.]|nr:hypothetical protein [Hyphomicrobium sp.]